MNTFSESVDRGMASGISLVVPVRDEVSSLAALMDSIRRQTRPPDEVVLVDGGSTDGTVELAVSLTAGDPRFRIVRAGPATPGRGRNVGIEAARHDWIALTDAGITLELDWLQRLAELLGRSPETDVVYGNYEAVSGSFFERCAALAYVAPKQHRDGRSMRGPSIASCLIRRSAWEAVGGFPDLRAAEDLIFMERVESAGFRIAWAPAATVHWRLQPTLGRTFRKFVLYSRHNVWAGHQRDWHYGIARIYLVSALFLLPALLQSIWWLAGPAFVAAARVARSIWRRGETHRFAALCDLRRFATVGLILLTIDLATFVGWLQALRRHPAPPQVVAERP